MIDPALRGDDARWLAVALALAARARGRTGPNPMVGAVVVQRGRRVGEGFHAKAGEPHAEPLALARAGAQARGATLYVTLEPCHHTGRTGPCTAAILRAGVARVVVGASDNDLRVRGRGLRHLRRHGVQVREGVRAAECLQLNVAYHFAKAHGRAWVAGLCAPLGRGQTPATRLQHGLRNALDAVAISAARLRQRRDALPCRQRGGRDPARLVFDVSATLSPQAPVMSTAALRRAPTYVAHGQDASAAWQRRLTEAGATLLPVAPGVPAARLRAVLAAVCLRGVHSVLVDEDRPLLSALAQARLLERLWGTGAPVARGTVPAALGGLSHVVPDWQQQVDGWQLWAGTPAPSLAVHRF